MRVFDNIGVVLSNEALFGSFGPLLGDLGGVLGGSFFEKFHLQISQWLMFVGGCLSVGVFFLSLGKEIIRQLFRC